ncbi:type II toxin-antitoxin system antitoxin DNA ADP-ribosyl glycohydrolase DarG [Chlorobium phaeovibrioides]|uniref:Appr-1-p processing protein n=1 Tax=Chlorobium phaeovibrioides TaxID=1094 RepID=A0ABW9UPM0_CHLPH|nr:macro domain-containing protein [Chlorobium phaeovibrioides]MWV54993.1 Appr-1-p processing protein [Chlorobium phaeovibrioides]
MIAYKKGNLLAEEAEALVNTVNCVGVMGRGIALQFKNVYPENFKAYAAACRREEVVPGKMFVYETGQLTNPRYIINFPTKRHWREQSRLQDIKSGLQDLVGEIRSRGITSIAIPPLGSGLGGLYWPDVRALIEESFHDLDGVRVLVFEPAEDPHAVRCNNHTRDVPNMTAGRAALLCLMARYRDGLLDPFISLLEVHKLMYFMQVSGEPLRLSFTKGHYGPYAENLRHVLKALEGHRISGYDDGGDQPDKPLSLMSGALDDARRFLEGEAATRERLDRVGHLVEGFESSFGLELLSTVHWVASQQDVASLDDVVKGVYAWGKRKEQFRERQIRKAVDILVYKGWLDGKAVCSGMQCGV